MSEAAMAAQRAEGAALNARCAASPREAANFAARLRRTPHSEKVVVLIKCTNNNYAALVRLLLADGLTPNTVAELNKDLSRCCTLPPSIARSTCCASCWRLVLTPTAATLLETRR